MLLPRPRLAGPGAVLRVSVPWTRLWVHSWGWGAEGFSARQPGPAPEMQGKRPHATTDPAPVPLQGA